MPATWKYQAIHRHRDEPVGQWREVCGVTVGDEAGGFPMASPAGAIHDCSAFRRASGP